ncbi:MAG: LPP20 family lipoprotein [Bacteroidales bacterium]|nr:LPP20 family lipoprotein [Bacteroidales bacterium]
MKKILFALIATFVLSCGISNRVEPFKNIEDNSTEFIGIGRGESMSYNAAKQLAENAARAEISTKIESRVQSFTEEYSGEFSTVKGKKKGKPQQENINETYSSTRADNTFYSYTKDHKVIKQGNKYIYWVLMASPKNKTAEDIISGSALKNMDEGTREVISKHRDDFIRRMTN